jgi:hypothetical protein
MEELNLASMFAKDDENDPRPNRKRKRPIRARTGVGMEKPEEPSIDSVEDDLGEGGEPAELAPDEETPEEDEAFEALLSRMEGGSASEGRAAKKRKLPKPGPDSLRAEFKDRM